MKTALLRLSFGMLFVLAGAVACRQSDPSGDPKTPPNSPLPRIEPTEEHTEPPTLRFGDAG